MTLSCVARRSARRTIFRRRWRRRAGMPRFGGALRLVEDEVERDVDEAGEVFDSLDVA